MTEEGTRASVRDELRRLLDDHGRDDSIWVVSGTYRGVAVVFGYSSNEREDAAATEWHTWVHAEYPQDYPLYLDLRVRERDDPPETRAPFFAELHGKAAPLDIVSQLLDARTCRELRHLQRVKLQTFFIGELIPAARRDPAGLWLSVPGWVDDPAIARQLIDIASGLVSELDNARRSADAAAGSAGGSAYRGASADLEQLHIQRMAEIDAERGITARTRMLDKTLNTFGTLLKFCVYAFLAFEFIYLVLLILGFWS